MYQNNITSIYLETYGLVVGECALRDAVDGSGVVYSSTVIGLRTSQVNHSTMCQKCMHVMANHYTKGTNAAIF